MCCIINCLLLILLLILSLFVILHCSSICYGTFMMTYVEQSSPWGFINIWKQSSAEHTSVEVTLCWLGHFQTFMTWQTSVWEIWQFGQLFDLFSEEVLFSSCLEFRVRMFEFRVVIFESQISRFDALFSNFESLRKVLVRGNSNVRHELMACDLYPINRLIRKTTWTSNHGGSHCRLGWEPTKN